MQLHKIVIMRGVLTLKLVTNNRPLIRKRGYDFIKSAGIIKNAGFDGYDHSMCIGEEFAKYVDELDSEYITACVDTRHAHLKQMR